MKVSVALIVSMTMLACVKQVPVSEQAAGIVVVNAFIETGSVIDDIKLTGLNTGEGVEGISGAEISISGNGTTHFLTEKPDSPGVYKDFTDLHIVPDKEYVMTIIHDGNTFSASTKSPKSLMALNVSKNFLDVELDNDLVFLEWEGLNEGSFNEYFYLVSIEPISPEDDLESIRIPSGDKGRKFISLSYNPELTLSTAQFNYYGNHLINVHAIRLEHESLFRSQMDFESNGVSNVAGAVGFFAGTSTLNTTIEVR